MRIFASTIGVSFIMALAVPGTSAAQPAAPGAAPPEAAVRKPARVGAKLGLTSATLALSGPDADDSLYERTTSFAVGGVGVLSVNDRASLQGELLYIRKGTGVDLSEFGGGDAAIRLDYIEIPVLVRYDLSSGPGTHAFVYGGGAVAMFMSGEVEVDGESEDIEDDLISSLDLALQIGGGVEIPMSSGAFTIDARYSHGLVNIDDTGDDVEVYNRVFSVFAGVLF